eukprot:8186070-Alexandrium_andersonii.AAC.1
MPRTGRSLRPPPTTGEAREGRRRGRGCRASPRPSAGDPGSAREAGVPPWPSAPGRRATSREA